MNSFSLALHHLLLVLLTAMADARTRCYTCINARSNEECNSKGKIELCSPNEQSCENEVRLSSPNGFGYLITKRCKQSLACANVQNQNRKAAWMPTQCNMQFIRNSVCRCCCSGDLCNFEELPCPDAKTCPQRGQLHNGRVTCSNFNFLGSRCEYHCNSGYAVGSHKVIECALNGEDAEWSDEAPICSATPCRVSVQPPPNGVMSCSNNFAIGSVCSFRCSVGYQIDGPRRVVCNSNGEWAHQPPRCERIRCQRKERPTFGSMGCSAEDQYDSICEFVCDQGYRLRGQAISVCQLNGRWSTPTPVCERVVCNELSNDFRNGARACTDGRFFGSTCAYSCDRGYSLRGSVSTNCLQDSKWSRSEPICERVHCGRSPRIPDNGDILCSNGNAYASVCQFLCKDGFTVVGPSDTTCQQNAEWSNEDAECTKISCTESHDSLANGKVECSDGKVYASECKFTCDAGFVRAGSEILTCQANLLWSSQAPVCQANSCSGELERPQNTRIQCSDENKAFSRCQYICGDGSDDWEITGETETVCQRNQASDLFEWSNLQPPCCAKRCPPFAKVDLFVVLDSSSSVGLENWNKTLHFVTEILDGFQISPEDLQIGLIRYNRIVDEENEIAIGQYATKAGTLNAILNMPYNGQGTNTGNAINFLVDEMMLRPGNRRDADDMVLLITDGRPRDNIEEPSIKLRATGAKTVVLGISDREGSLTKEDLSGITENTIVSTTGFDGISTDLIQAFIAQICRNTCERQKEYDIGA